MRSKADCTGPGICQAESSKSLKTHRIIYTVKETSVCLGGCGRTRDRGFIGASTYPRANPQPSQGAVFTQVVGRHCQVPWTRTIVTVCGWTIQLEGVWCCHGSKKGGNFAEFPPWVGGQGRILSGTECHPRLLLNHTPTAPPLEFSLVECTRPSG